MENLLILGAGGFGRVVREMAQESGRFGSIAFLDDDTSKPDVLGKMEEMERYFGEYTVALAAIGNNTVRLELLEKLEKIGYRLPVLIDPHAIVSHGAKIGAGTVVRPLALVSCGCTVGRGCILNAGCILDHDAVAEDGCHVCLNAVIKAEGVLPRCTKLEAGEILLSAREQRSRAAAAAQ